MTTAFELKELLRTDGSNGQTDPTSRSEDDAGLILRVEHGEPMRNQPNCNDDRCGILVVGSTGSGKSSTIARVTGQLVRAGDTHQSVTRTSSTYTVRRSFLDTLRLPSPMSPADMDSLRFIDTVGWEDADADDLDTFQSMLRALNRYNLTKLRAVIWTLHPGTIRKTEGVARMARLIEQFDERGRIWDNVILICKQSLNAEHDSAGALRAIAEMHPLAKPQVLGYRYLDDSTLDEAQRRYYEANGDARKVFRVFDDEQVAAEVWESIAKISENIQILFNHFRCLNCGATGDRRLLPQFCHLQKIFRHPEPLSLRHPATSELYHPCAGSEWVHPSSDLESPGPDCSTMVRKAFCCCCCCSGDRERRTALHSCCRREVGSRGCEERWKCCSMRRLGGGGGGDRADEIAAGATSVKENGAPLRVGGCRRRWACCRTDVEDYREMAGCRPFYNCCQGVPDSEGCEAVCKKCGRKWGTEAKGCFRTEHFLIDLDNGFLNDAVQHRTQCYSLI